MTPERVDQIISMLPSDYSDGTPFDLCFVWCKLNKGQICNSDARKALCDELVIVGNVYGLTFRHNGDYCWFDNSPKE